jgi:hypothetical protein
MARLEINENKISWPAWIISAFISSKKERRLFGLVVRVSGYRYRGPGSGTGSTQPREVNWGATWIKSSGARFRKLRLTAVVIRCDDHVTSLYPQKLALTLPTGSGRSVGIVRSRTKATEFSLCLKGQRRIRHALDLVTIVPAQIRTKHLPHTTPDHLPPTMINVFLSPSSQTTP